MVIRHQWQEPLAKGNVVVLVLIVLTVTMLEIAMLSLILTRGLSAEAQLSGRQLTVRNAAETAITRLSNNLWTYVLASGTGSVNTAFARGGSNDIDSTALSAVNPETSGTEATNITIDAWLQERRGPYYHIVGQARYGETTIQMHRWMTVNTCTASAGSSGISTILGSVQWDHWYIGRESTAVDSTTGTLFFF